MKYNKTNVDSTRYIDPRTRNVEYINFMPEVTFCDTRLNIILSQPICAITWTTWKIAIARASCPNLYGPIYFATTPSAVLASDMTKVGTNKIVLPVYLTSSIEH